MTRKLNYHLNRSRKRQSGNGLPDIFLKLAKHLGPSALKLLEGVAGGVGEKLGKMISGKGMPPKIDSVQGFQAAQSGIISGSGYKLAGSGSRLAGGSWRLAGIDNTGPKKKKINY